MKYYKEILLAEAIIFILAWVMDEYIATLLTFIAVPIFTAIFLISILAEMLEKSRVNKEYFMLMLGLAVIPAIIFFIIFKTNDGTSFDWSGK